MEKNLLSRVIFLMFFVSSSLFILSQAITPAGTIERITKQQLLASIPPNVGPTPAGSSQLFLTSPSGKYSVFLLRRETTLGAGGFGSDFCYMQVQDSGVSVWESECTPVSTANTCSLVFGEGGLEIFDGSSSAWDGDVDGDEPLETLEILDTGDMRIRDKEGQLQWRASDNPIVNQNCGSIGAPGLSPVLPPFASPVHGGDEDHRGPFGQPGPIPVGNGVGNQGLVEPVPADQEQPEDQVIATAPAPLDDSEQLPEQAIGNPHHGVSSKPLSAGLNQPFGGAAGANQEPLVDNTPYDSGCSKNKVFGLGFGLIAVLWCL
ncbi:hypothetical protein MKW92_002844 [Papaver armeniacum]|nr:hypothetical protein MKW92_002844 [Papaver armeniacum]